MAPQHKISPRTHTHTHTRSFSLEWSVEKLIVESECARNCLHLFSFTNCYDLEAQIGKLYRYFAFANMKSHVQRMMIVYLEIIMVRSLSFHSGADETVLPLSGVKEQTIKFHFFFLNFILRFGPKQLSSSLCTIHIAQSNGMNNFF